MSKKAVIGIGAGCLGCVGIPALLAIGGAAGWMLANQQRDAELALLEEPVLGGLGSYEEESSWRSEPVRESRERAEIEVKPVEKATPRVWDEVETIETPAPVVARLSVSTPAPAPTPAPVVVEKKAVAKPAPVVAEKKVVATPKAVATPAPAALSSAASAPAPKPASAPVNVLKSSPLPKSTPRSFDDAEDLFAKKAKPAKTPALASAAPAAAGTATEEDLAAAALFGDEPGSNVRKIKTKGGTVEVRLQKQIVLQTTDKKTVMGTLVKAEGGSIGVRLSDGTVKTIAESQIADASEL